MPMRFRSMEREGGGMATRPRNAGGFAGAGLLAVLALTWARSAAGQEGAQITIGPYVQAIGRHEATVRWETVTPTAGRLAWGRTAECTYTAGDPRVSVQHEIHLTGLRAATRYWYRIADTGESSAVSPFTTEGDRANPVRIVVFGDTRTGDAAHAQVVAGAAAAEPSLLLNVGDLVQSPTEGYWRTFFAIEAPLVSQVPLFPVLGNHEGNGTRYLQLFALPDEGEGHGRYYSIRWGLVAILALDTQQSVAPGGAQYAWVEQALAELAANPDVTFILCVLHHGPFCAASGHGSNLNVRSYLVPLFEKHGVDIVFSGHDHVYERGTVNGVKYVVTGGGGAPLHAAGWDWWTEVSASLHEYCVVDVEGGSLEFAAFEAGTGNLIDAFQLTKRADECTDDPGCSGLTARECPVGEVGQFRCAATTCVWNCSQGRSSTSVSQRLRRVGR
jgi:acid phosphatase type 7